MESDELPPAQPEGNKRFAADGGDDAEAADRPAKKPRAEEEQEQQRLDAAEPAADAAAAAALDQPQPLSESEADPTEAAVTAPAAAGAADAAQPEALPTTPSKASAVAAAAGASHDTKATPSPRTQHKPARLGDVVYRVLVPARAVSIVIGKQGCNVRELQDNSGARIQVGASQHSTARQQRHTTAVSEHTTSTVRQWSGHKSRAHDGGAPSFPAAGHDSTAALAATPYTEQCLRNAHTRMLLLDDAPSCVSLHALYASCPCPSWCAVGVHTGANCSPHL